jgi:hypothetical protein
MPQTVQSTDYDEWIRLGQRIQRALTIHHYPDTPAIQQAREALRAALQREPEHRTDAAAVRYRRRIIETFDRAVERDSRLSR